MAKNYTPINCNLTPHARDYLLRLLERRKARGYVAPVLCLLKATDEKWYAEVYNQTNIDGLAPKLASLGKPLIYMLDGLEFAIPQFNFLHELSGKTIDYKDRSIFLEENNAT